MSKRSVLLAAALALALAMPALARTRTYYGFHVTVGDAPPPPQVVYTEPPPAVIIPRTRVYQVNNSDYDVFRVGNIYYLSYNGYWYRARSYRGPWVAIDARRVPSSIYMVPASNWRHSEWSPWRDTKHRRARWQYSD